MNKTIEEYLKGFGGKPRDPNRIYPIMLKLTELWANNPDLRFWQLLSMLNPHKNDLFYTEDDWTLARLEQLLIDGKV
jgi:hypothetical protein